MPAANWLWSIGPWKAGASAKPVLVGSGGPAAFLGTATARSLKLRLLEPSDASFTVSGASAEASVVEELVTDLWVYRDGVGLFRGRVTKTHDTVGASKARHDLAVDVRDYRYVLDRRIAYADRTWTGIEQSTIAWDAITDTQLLGGGNLGLTQGTWPTTGVVRPSVTLKAGDSVWSLVKSLGAMSNGFNFDIDEDLAANLYWPQRGASNGAYLDYGGTIAEFDRTFDAAQYGNAVRQSGADTVTPTSLAVPDIGTAREGRWDVQFSDTQLNTADMVARTAETNLARASGRLPGDGGPLPVYGLTFAKGRWGGPGHVWLGDYVTVVAQVGRLDEQAMARVYELHIDVDSTNQETVTAVVGDVRLDTQSVLRGIAKRVQVLSRR